MTEQPAVAIGFYLFLGFSMTRLWLMLSTIQIFLHFPLLQINYPLNVEILFDTLIKITDLSVILKKII